MSSLNPGILDISTASDLVDLSIQDKWLKTPGSEHMQNFRKFCNVRTGNPDYTVKDTAISGGGSFQRKPEGGVRAKDKPIQGFNKSINMVEFAVQFEVTRKMLKNLASLKWKHFRKKLSKLQETLLGDNLQPSLEWEGSTTIMGVPKQIMLWVME